MVIRTPGFSTSVGSDDDDFAFVYCVDRSGYCLSLARFPTDELVEIMVVDQRVHKTREVTVELCREQLRLSLSDAAAAELDGVTEYRVPLVSSDEELRKLDAALSVIFEGDNRGIYIRRL